MIFDAMVMPTAHNPNSKQADLMEAHLCAGERPLTEFAPELATPVGKCWSTGFLQSRVRS
jgi:hypothetical protein